MKQRIETVPASAPILVISPDMADGRCTMFAAMARSGRVIEAVDDEYSAVAVLRAVQLAAVVLADDLPGPAQALVARHAANVAVPVLIANRMAPPGAADLARYAAASPVMPRPDPLTRLAPLFGHAGMVDLLARFRDRLAVLIATADPLSAGEGATRAAVAHRLAGMAGMLDLPELAGAWAAVEQGGDAHWPDAWTESRIALAQLDRLLR